MDIERVATLLRSVAAPSRRGLLAALRGGLLALLAGGSGGEAAAAKRRHRRTRKRKKPCGRCRHRRQGRCRPRPDGIVCPGGVCQGGRCVCPCPPGQTCLSNGSCATICASAGEDSPDCPANCGCPGPNAEGVKLCSPFLVGSCPAQPCASTAECPRGTHCKACQGATVCMPLCGDG